MVDCAYFSYGWCPMTLTETAVELVWKNAFEQLVNSTYEHFGWLPGDYDMILLEAMAGIHRVTTPLCGGCSHPQSSHIPAEGCTMFLGVGFGSCECSLYGLPSSTNG